MFCVFVCGVFYIVNLCFQHITAEEKHAEQLMDIAEQQQNRNVFQHGILQLHLGVWELPTICEVFYLSPTEALTLLILVLRVFKRHTVLDCAKGAAVENIVGNLHHILGWLCAVKEEFVQLNCRFKEFF